MYSRNYLNEDFLGPSYRNSNEALITSEDLCAWNIKPAQLAPTTQYNFFPLHSKQIKSKSPNKVKLTQTSFRKKPHKTTLSPVNNLRESKIMNRSLDESECRLIDLFKNKGKLPPLKVAVYNIYYKSAAKERTLEGFLNKCKEMIRENKQNKMRSTSPCRFVKKFV